MPSRVLCVLPLIVFLAGCATARNGVDAEVRPSGAAGRAVTVGPLPDTSLTVRLEDRFYHVRGTSADHLNLDLASRGPRDGGVHWHALTHFALRWSYVPRTTGGRCAPDRVALEVDVITTLPRWDDLGRASPSLVADWRLYFSRLRAHEDEHRRIAVSAGQELLQTVAELSAPDCRALGRKARQVTARFQDRVDAAQERWDRVTAHGADAGL